MTLKCSIFTPVAKTQYLDEAHRSLLLQNAPWEWVLGLTNNLTESDIPDRIRQDRRTKIIRCQPVEDDLKPGIGAAKRDCCDAATGDIFVELDHDDVLVPGILSLVVKEVEKGAGFVYSDAAVFTDKTLQPSTYSEAYGWGSYPFRIYGKELEASRAFPVTARSLSDISFSPDHVRCWSRRIYYRAGGHDRALPVGDDHDLLCRTYLTGAKMAQTGTVGYLYRWHGQNTVRRFNKKIQDQNVKNRAKYISPMIDEWVRRENLPRVAVSSWRDALQGTWRKRREGTVGHIELDHVLEALTPQQYQQVLSHAWKILVPGGWLSIRAVSSACKWADLPHCRSRWNEVVVSQLCSPTYLERLDPDLESTCRFQPVRIMEERDRTVDHGADRAPFLRITAELCCLKGQRQPGLIPQ